MSSEQVCPQEGGLREWTFAKKPGEKSSLLLDNARSYDGLTDHFYGQVRNPFVETGELGWRGSCSST
jgi:hypothetical protein